MVTINKLLKAVVSGSIVVNIATIGATFSQQKVLAAFLSDYSGASSFAVENSSDDATFISDLSFFREKTLGFTEGMNHGQDVKTKLTCGSIYLALKRVKNYRD